MSHNLNASNRKSTDSLIAPGDVDRVFDDQMIECLAKIAKLPEALDIRKFGENVRIPARMFVEAKRQLTPSQVGAAIKRLYRITVKVEDGSDETARALALEIGNMRPEVRQWLQRCHPSNLTFPEPAHILCNSTRSDAIIKFRQILSYGGKMGPGRTRSEGRRSWSFHPLLRIPQGITRGRPLGDAERDFVQWLAIAYLEPANQPPPFTVHYDFRGPFSKFVHRCFELSGAPAGNVTRLINQYGRCRRRLSGARDERNKEL